MTEEEAGLAKSMQRSVKQLRLAADAIEARLNEMLNQVPAREKLAVKDSNGEPTWNYLVKRRVPEDIYLTAEFLHYGLANGFTAEQTKILFEGQGSYSGFKKYFLEKGTKHERWTLVWQRWVRQSHEHQEKKKTGGGAATRSDTALQNYR